MRTLMYSVNVLFVRLGSHCREGHLLIVQHGREGNLLIVQHGREGNLLIVHSLLCRISTRLHGQCRGNLAQATKAQVFALLDSAIQSTVARETAQLFAGQLFWRAFLDISLDEIEAFARTGTDLRVGW